MEGEKPSSRRPCRDASPVGADLSALPHPVIDGANRLPDLGAPLPSGFLDRLMHPAVLGWLWGFLPGPRELALVALVVVALYGRSETARRGFARLARPWTTRPGETSATNPARLADRWLLVVTAIASAAVAAWVVTWMTVVHRPPGP
jgi:hypothetical protein